MDEGKVVGIIFLDFTKAFNTVPHVILLGKLSSCELNRFTLRWVMNWINDRAQRVIMKGNTSGC